MHQIFAVVYDPLNTVHQLLLGHFWNNGNAHWVLTKDKDGLNSLGILYCDSTRTDMSGETFLVEKTGKVIIPTHPGIYPPYKGQIFYRTKGINRVHPWVWRDGKGKVWITTEDFGRFLTYLTKLPVV